MSTPKIKVFSNGYSKAEVDTKFATIEKRVSNLEQQLAPSFIETDESVAREKIAPANACSYAQINKIGGMSYGYKQVTNNLLFGYISSRTIEQDGVTVTILPDGHFTIEGYCTYGINIDIIPLRFPIGVSVSQATLCTNVDNRCCIKVFEGAMIDTDGDGVDDSVMETPIVDLTADSNSYSIGSAYNIVMVTLYITPDSSFGNEEFYFSMNDGTEAQEPTRYFSGLRETKVTALKSKGAQLIPFPYVDGDARTLNGGTFTVESDGGIVLSGTPTGASLFMLVDRYPIPSLKSFTVSTYGTFVNVNIRIMLYDADNEQLTMKQTIDSIAIDLSEFPTAKYISLHLYRRANDVEMSGKIYPMWNFGNVAAPWIPYRSEPVDTFQIPEALIAFLEDKGYGQSNPDNPNEYNYIDFERKVFAAYGHTVDGAWVAYAKLSETDISDYLTDDTFIEVESGGLITAIDDNGNDCEVMTSITYMLEDTV